MIFTVEIKDAAKAQEESAEVEIHLDQESLESFIKQLQMIQAGQTDHIHFMSESWGMGDLTEEKQGGNKNSLVHHLKVLKWG